MPARLLIDLMINVQWWELSVTTTRMCVLRVRVLCCAVCAHAVCMCVCVYVAFKYVGTCAWGGLNRMSNFFFNCFPPLFLESVSYGSESLLFGLGWLMRVISGSLPINAGAIRTCRHTWLPPGHWLLVLKNQVFCTLNHLPRPSANLLSLTSGI